MSRADGHHSEGDGGPRPRRRENALTDPALRRSSRTPVVVGFLPDWKSMTRAEKLTWAGPVADRIRAGGGPTATEPVDPSGDG